MQIWDVEAKKRIRVMRGHSARISCLDWNSHILASGCRSGEIHYHDVRVAEYYFCSLKAHAQVKQALLKHSLTLFRGLYVPLSPAAFPRKSVV